MLPTAAPSLAVAAASTPLPHVNVAAAFAASAQRFANSPFICVLPETAATYAIPAEELSYAQVYKQVAALQAAYARAGYGHGHRIGLLLENRPDFLRHWFALNALGVSVVPMNSDLRRAELGYLIDHSDLILIVAIPRLHAHLQDAAQSVQRSIAIISADEAPPQASSPAPLKHERVNERTECALLYTSGTTGRPKGCMLDNRYFLHVGAWYIQAGGMATIRPGLERMLSPLPLVHMNAMAYSTMAMMLSGGCLILLDRFHPRTWWQSVQAARATIVHYLGVMPAMLMQAPTQPLERNHGLRFGFGAGVDRNVHAAFEARFNFPLLEAWAMTETGAGAVILAHHEPRQIGSHCFGREGDDVEVLIVDDAAQPIYTDNTPGELWVRHAGPDPRYGFFTAYLKNDEATAQAWQGAWFHTGDMVQRDASGSLHFIDRRKNLIRRSGENIAAVEVESVLLQHPDIKAAAVCPVPDALRQEEVFACIVARCPVSTQAEKTTLAQRIVRHCLAHLAYYKAPGYCLFVPALPLTASQKVQRGELRHIALNALAQGQCIDTITLKKRSA